MIVDLISLSQDMQIESGKIEDSIVLRLPDGQVLRANIDEEAVRKLHAYLKSLLHEQAITKQPVVTQDDMGNPVLQEPESYMDYDDEVSQA
jgi:hypothetical protein